jgi:hypothetical protein
MERDFGTGKYLSLWIFAIAFGYIEAAVVIYLRNVFGLDSGSLFPVASALNEPASQVVSVEVGREVATLAVMLIPAHFASRRNVYRVLAYLLIFAVWDLSYYGFLRIHLGWPPSLFTYDILFLIPTLWVSPVLCPVLISGSIVLYASGLMALARHRSMRAPPVFHWVLILVGIGLVLYAFTSEAEYFLAGGLPPRFQWLPFVAGYLLATGVGLHYFYLISRKPRMRFL